MMKNKQHSIWLFIFLHSVYISPLIGSFDNDSIKGLFSNPWKYVEYVFITKPHKTMKKIRFQLKLIVPTLVAGSSAGLISHEFSQNHLPKHNETFDITSFFKIVGVPILSSVVGVETYKILKEKVKSNIEYKIMTKFIQQWPKNKTSTPEVLHKAFNSLYEQYQSNLPKKKIKSLALEVFDATKTIIYEHFPNKYEHHLLDNHEHSLRYMFYNTLLSCDVANLIDLMITFIKLFFN